MCNLHWCCTFCTSVTLELHCSQPIRIEWFFSCILLRVKYYFAKLIFSALELHCCTILVSVNYFFFTFSNSIFVTRTKRTKTTWMKMNTVEMWVTLTLIRFDLSQLTTPGQLSAKNRHYETTFVFLIRSNSNTCFFF